MQIKNVLVLCRRKASGVCWPFLAKLKTLFLLFSFGPNRTLIWPNSDIHSAQFGHSFAPIQTFIRPNSDIHLAQFRHSFGPIPTFIWPIRTFIWRSWKLWEAKYKKVPSFIWGQSEVNHLPKASSIQSIDRFQNFEEKELFLLAA